MHISLAPSLFQGSASRFLNSWLQKSAQIHHTQLAPAFGCTELRQEGLRPASSPSATHKPALKAGDCKTRLRSPQLPLITCITSCFLSSERTTSQLTFCRYLPPITEKRSYAGALHFIKQFPPPLIKQSHSIPRGFNNNNQLLTGGSNCYG